MSTDDDDDLDRPIQSQSQTQKHSHIIQKSPPQARSPSPQELPTPNLETQPEATSKRKVFRIGGKTKDWIKEPSPPVQRQENIAADKYTAASSPPQHVPTEAGSTPKKVRRPFKIGGKGKSTNVGGQEDEDSVTTTNQKKIIQSPRAQPASLPRARVMKDATPEKTQEETPEEKAERKRAELKRKNDEAAKKQAQSKKKKRF